MTNIINFWGKKRAKRNQMTFTFCNLNQMNPDIIKTRINKKMGKKGSQNKGFPYNL